MDFPGPCLFSKTFQEFKTWKTFKKFQGPKQTQHYCLLFQSSSRMRVIYHNWSATKQRPHPQTVAEISRHSVLSGDSIRQCETSSGSRYKDTDQCL